MKIHDLLIEKCLSEEYKKTMNSLEHYIENQAGRCEYYIPLRGDLGMDWGIIINPKSSRFGLLAFEHDICGCPE